MSRTQNLEPTNQPTREPANHGELQRPLGSRRHHHGAINIADVAFIGLVTPAMFGGAKAYQTPAVACPAD